MAYRQEDAPLAQPQEIRLEPQAAYILWDDGHLGVYPYPLLRASCPCVTCTEAGVKRGPGIPVRSIPEDPRVADWALVGRYALQFLWNDGHSDGIYDFPLLRALCLCTQCLAQRG